MKTRQSNIELLRIFAMVLVMIVHADFYSLGDATLENSHNSMTELSIKFFFESLSIGCVDIFILISGYFGIRPKASGFAKFAFQCLFIFLLVYFCCVILGLQPLAPKGIADCLCLFRQSNWFIQAYVLLYLLSPVLNVFCQNTDRTTFKNVLVGFFVFQTIYGCTGSANFFVGGFSTISFIGLYLLARYVRLYPNNLTSKSPLFDFCIFGGVVVLMTLMGICPSVTGFTVPYLSSYNYINPLIITSSLYLLLGFTKLDIGTIPIINYIAASSFTVYLFHSSPHFLGPIYKEHILRIYNTCNGTGVILLAIAIYIIIVFIVSILIDQFRILAWKYTSKLIFKV